MRLRNTLAAATGAFALVLTLPTSASAATGELTYVFIDSHGARQTGVLIDPPSRECITIPEAADEARLPAHSPVNSTDATATVFSGIGCQGDYFTLRPQGGRASERLKVRSVVFS
ncbi:hypothetical protein [Peterkaempfera bronchialis]|uniref:hypothetical protein n=1 Tax=Peterkaempfera bronchialis TaxID=2126346 RepID=UPI003C2B10FE